MDKMQSVRPKTVPLSSHPVSYSGEYKTVDDYAEALRSWMLNFYHFQCASAAFPFFLANIQASNAARSSSSDVSGTNTRMQSTSGPGGIQGQNDGRSNQSTGVSAGVEYVIPPIWKRIFAEIIDFLMLFLMKILLTYFAMDLFDLNLLDEVNKYDFDSLTSDVMSDYKLALSMTTEIVLLDLVHRLGTCLFETICLCRSAGRTGGATPGKKVMGLRVIKCDHATYSLTGPAMVVVRPAEDLGIYRALVRSFLKNLAVTFLFPIGLTMFSFRHSRTIYDILSGSIVVEVNDR